MDETIKVYRIATRQTYVIGFVFLTVIGSAGVYVHHWVPRLIGAICFLFALVTLFVQEVQIDVKSGHVIEVARILGVAPVWRRLRRLNDFAGIRCFRDYQDDAWDSWQVVLLPHSGPTIYFNRFSIPANQDCTEAKAFAQELADVTGLGVVDRVA